MSSKPQKPRSIDNVAGNLASLAAAPARSVEARRMGLPPIARAIETQNIDALERVKELESEIQAMRADGQHIREIETGLIDVSRYRDRDDRFVTDESFTALWMSIKEEGQHVPVLLRPKPD